MQCSLFLSWFPLATARLGLLSFRFSSSCSDGEAPSPSHPSVGTGPSAADRPGDAGGPAGMPGAAAVEGVGS